jgi:3-oxoacyl-[acyl-carrier-protein] synthase-1
LGTAAGRLIRPEQPRWRRLDFALDSNPSAYQSGLVVQPLFVNAYTAVTALGAGCAAHHAALVAMRSGLAPNDFAPARIDSYIGRVAGVEAVELPETLRDFDCRNNRLAWLGLQQDSFMEAVRRAVGRYGAQRIAVIAGTSTSGVLTTELGYRDRDPSTGALPATVRYAETHNFSALTEFVRRALALTGPSLTISTACSSSAKVFATASRWIAAGVVDAAVVAGADSLCGTILHGFNSLQLVSRTPCRPFDVARDGLTLGEGAGYALLEREATSEPNPIALLGYGESADAHHMSAPHPEGLGARLAMSAALERSRRAPVDIDFVCAHGTATRNNDVVEARAIAEVVTPDTPVTSIKGFVGHTLGASGIISAVAGLLALERGFIPGTVNTTAVDPGCTAKIQLQSVARPVRTVLVNALGFGGNNASLVLGVAR